MLEQTKIKAKKVDLFELDWDIKVANLNCSKTNTALNATEVCTMAECPGTQLTQCCWYKYKEGGGYA